MSQVYVWSPTPDVGEQAEARFGRMLQAQRKKYSDALSRDFFTATRRVGNVSIGLLWTDTGVLGWKPWRNEGVRGVAFSGVCEDVLDDASSVDELVQAAFHDPGGIAEWQGAFSFVAWDEHVERVAVVTAATQPQTLWRTEGSEGWAIGSRAGPLLHLVGREPELDATQATLYLAFGYLAGDGSLFRGVERVPSRTRLLAEDGGTPRCDTYISLPEYLAAGDTQGVGFARAVDVTADRFASRVARQLGHSSDPLISLTGGRDSRCIAAALTRAGYAGPTHTGGTDAAADVLLAARVARTLNLHHRHDSSETDNLDILVDHRERARLWSSLSEGVETIRHALHFAQFFAAPDAPAGSMQQTFNGLKPGLNRPFVPDQGGLIAKIVPSLHAAQTARDRYAEILDRLARASDASGGGTADWRELFFWQRWALHWGQDNMAAKFGIAFWWTPLMDKSLIRASWWLPEDRKSSNAFIEALTARLAPELAGVPYDAYHQGAVAKMWNRIRRKLPASLRKSPKADFELGPNRRERWTQLLLEGETRVWPSLVEEAYVRRIVDERPDAHILWSLATIESFAEACLDDSADGV